MKLHSNSLLIYFVTFCTSLHKNPDFYDSRILNFSHSYIRKGLECKTKMEIKNLQIDTIHQKRSSLSL